MRGSFSRFLGVVAALLIVPAAWSGPVILTGNDIDDHGSATASANQEGWLFLQRSFEAIASKVSNGQKVVVCLGCNGQVAANAFASAFDKSSLPAAGWTRKSVNSATELSGFFSATLAAGVQNIFNTGIVYMPSDRVNTLGGLTEAQVDVINANFSAVVGHIDRGGGVMSLMQSGIVGGYGWIKSAIPGITIETTGIVADVELVATVALAEEFPTLSLTTLGSASHAHMHFKGPLGGLRELGLGAGSASAGEFLDVKKAEGGSSIGVIIGGANANLNPGNSTPNGNIGGDAENVPVNSPFALGALLFIIALVARRHVAQRAR